MTCPKVQNRNVWWGLNTDFKTTIIFNLFLMKIGKIKDETLQTNLIFNVHFWRPL